MSSKKKSLKEEQIEKQSKQPDEKCDYLHPEECSEQQGNDLEATREEVEEEAQEFIEEKKAQ